MAVMEEYVWSYFNEGLVPIPLGVNKKNDIKAPSIRWQKYQAIFPDKKEIETWLKKGLYKEVGVICGIISNNLAVIDIDEFKIINETGIKLQKLMNKGI